MLSKKILSFLVIITISLASQAQVESHIAIKLDTLFHDLNRTNSPGAAIGVFKDGQIFYMNEYGMADLEHAIPINEKTVFHVGSISKQFVAMSILLLQEQGKLSLDDDIHKYLSELPNYNDVITIKHLLHHTSGIKDHLELQTLKGLNVLNDFAKESIYQLLVNQKSLNFKPGEKYQYSNGGYLLLAKIVNKVSNQTLKDFAFENIFRPLGMNNSTFYDDNGDLIENRAMGYSINEKEGLRNVTMRFDGVGCVGLYTTIEDFFKWDQNFIDNKLGNKSSRLTQKMREKGQLGNREKISYGLGLRLEKYKGLNTYGHGGAFGGYRAYYKRFYEQNCAIVIFGNFSQFDPRKIVNKVVDILFEDQITKEPEIQVIKYSKEDAVEISVELLDTYTDYYSKGGKVVKFYVKQDLLYCQQLWNNNSYPIFSKSENEFFVDNSNIFFEFLIGGNEVVLHQNEKSHWNKLNLDVFIEEERNKYQGKYYCEELDVSYLIKRNKDKTILVIPNSEGSPFSFIGKNHAVVDQSIMIFIRGKRNRITGFYLNTDLCGNFYFEKR